MKSIEELMQPRYKVIADYPGSPFDLSAVCTMKTIGIMQGLAEVRPYGATQCGVYPEQYPSIFQPLEWYEDRELSDLPAYVKVTNEKVSIPEGSVWKVAEWEDVRNDQSYLTPWLCCVHGREGRYSIRRLEPATLAEFNQYQSTACKGD